MRYYHHEDRRVRAIKPGQQTFLNPTGKVDQNVVGGVGNYSIAPHIYASGMKPGDILKLTLVWQNTRNNPRPWEKPSQHYTEDLIADKNGEIKATRVFMRPVVAGDMVFVRLLADKDNTRDVKLELLDCDSFLYIPN